MLSALKQLEELHDKAREAMAEAYRLKFAFRSQSKALKALKGQSDKQYKKYCYEARKQAKKNKPRGRGVADHIISVYACYILGIPASAVSRPSNLELTTKVLNNKKGLKSDWSRFKEIFPEYQHLIKEQEK
jgi:hypothetical protein